MRCRESRKRAYASLPKVDFTRSHCRSALLTLILPLFSALILAQAPPRNTIGLKTEDPCQRYSPGTALAEPRDIHSEKGSLKVTLTVHSSTDSNRHGSDSIHNHSSWPAAGAPASLSYDSILGHVRYCYTDEQGDQAPTLRLNPGGELFIRLKNDISLPTPESASTSHSSAAHKSGPVADACAGGPMTPASTNLHFHGLSLPPVCHQDETVKTLVQPGDPPFEYHVRIPKNQPPGLYWYHPHVHGFTEEQLLGGASGALIVEGMDKAVPRVAGLPERVFIIRDEKMPDPSESEKADPKRPTKQISINYVPVPYPKYPPAVINMKPLERQFWRVLNASADTYLNLSLLYDGKRQNMDLVALDGVPLHYGEPGAKDYEPQNTNIFLSPAARAEFIVTGPPSGVTGMLVTSGVFRGAEDDSGATVKKDSSQPALRVGLDDVDPPRPLATIIASIDDATPRYVARNSSVRLDSTTASLSSVKPVRKRKLYFSEKASRPDDPNSPTFFFITEEGHEPAVFDPHKTEPDIIVHQGDVEDWTIENRSRESHVFHIHQLHFLIVGSQGIGWHEPTLRDTVNLLAWDGFRRYPAAILRMDFRAPEIVGTFLFHCHIAQHADGGMMGTVRVEPAEKK